MRTIRTFNNVRARIFRTKLGTWHEGWTVHLGQGEARIRMETFAMLDAKEALEGECYGDGTLVRFAGQLAGQAGQEIAIRIVGSLSFEPSRDEVRLQVENVVGKIADATRESSFVVLDISPSGLTGLTEVAFAPLSSLRVSLELPNGRFAATVKLASCRADESETGHYRVELAIVEASRLDKATWQHLLESRAKA